MESLNLVRVGEEMCSLPKRSTDRPSLTPSKQEVERKAGSFQDPQLLQKLAPRASMRESLGATFARLWPVDERPCFAELLEALDEADRELDRSRDRVQPVRDERKID